MGGLGVLLSLVWLVSLCGGADECLPWPQPALLSAGEAPFSRTYGQRILRAVGFFPETRDMGESAYDLFRTAAKGQAEAQELMTKTQQTMQGKAGQRVGSGLVFVVFVFVLAFVMLCTGFCGCFVGLICAFRKPKNREPVPSGTLICRLGVVEALAVLTVGGLGLLWVYSTTMTGIPAQVLSQLNETGRLLNHSAYHYVQCKRDFLDELNGAVQDGLSDQARTVADKLAKGPEEFYAQERDRLAATLRGDFEELKKTGLKMATAMNRANGDAKKGLDQINDQAPYTPAGLADQVIDGFFDGPVPKISDDIYKEMEPQIAHAKALMDETLANMTESFGEGSSSSSSSSVQVADVPGMMNKTVTKSLVEWAGEALGCWVMRLGAVSVLFVAVAVVGAGLGLSPSPGLNSAGWLVSRLGGHALWVLSFFPLFGLALFLLLAWLLYIPCGMVFNDTPALLDLVGRVAQGAQEEGATAAQAVQTTLAPLLEQATGSGLDQCQGDLTSKPILQLFPQLEQPMTMAIAAGVAGAMGSQLAPKLANDVYPLVAKGLRENFLLKTHDYFKQTEPFFMDLKTGVEAEMNAAAAGSDQRAKGVAESQKDAFAEFHKVHKRINKALLDEVPHLNASLKRAQAGVPARIHVFTQEIRPSLELWMKKLWPMLVDNSPPCGPIKAIGRNIEVIGCGPLLDVWAPLGLLAALLLPSIVATFAMASTLRRKANAQPRHNATYPAEEKPPPYA